MPNDTYLPFRGAKQFLTRFGGGVGGIFAVFFFQIRPSRPNVEPWIWIIVGDIPSAYLPSRIAELPEKDQRVVIRLINSLSTVRASEACA